MQSTEGDNIRLEDEVAVIAGSTRGLRRAMAKLFADEGASVVVTGRHESMGKETVVAIRDRGHEAIFSRTDVTQDNDVAAAVQAAVGAFGMLSAVFNNAIPTKW